jgi:hypothetical protein
MSTSCCVGVRAKLTVDLFARAGLLSAGSSEVKLPTEEVLRAFISW